jgi:hypothetical protein
MVEPYALKLLIFAEAVFFLIREGDRPSWLPPLGALLGLFDVHQHMQAKHMAKMTKTEFARRHRINVTNIVWSWGGKQNDQAIVLFVWEDEIKKIGEKWCVQVLDPAFDNRLGFAERMRHLDDAKTQNLPIKLAIQQRNKMTQDEVSRTTGIRPELFAGGEPFQRHHITWIPIEGWRKI